MRDRYPCPEIVNVRCHVHEGKFKVYRTVEEVKECTPLLEDFRLILLQCKLVIDVLKLNRLCVIVTPDPADAVLEHPVKRNGLLCRSRDSIITARLLYDASYFFLFRSGQVSGNF